jgi:hypothetical protein
MYKGVYPYGFKSYIVTHYLMLLKGFYDLF